MPTVVEIDARTGKRVVREAPLTAQQIAAGEAERAEQDERATRADARAAALARGTGNVTRAEVEALKDALREALT